MLPSTGSAHSPVAFYFRNGWLFSPEYAAGCELPLFEPPAAEALFQASRGLPRQVNRIAHYALSAAALDGARTVNPDHLQRALDELRP